MVELILMTTLFGSNTPGATYTLALLPKTLTRATLSFKDSHVPFSVLSMDDHPDNVAKLDEALPNLRYLTIATRSMSPMAKDRIWSFPSALLSCNCSGLYSIAPLPPVLETLIVHPGITLAPTILYALPKTLVSLSVPSVLPGLPHLPLLRSLTCKTSSTSSTIELPPTLTEFFELYHGRMTDVTHVVWPVALKSLHMRLKLTTDLMIPSTLTKWTSHQDYIDTFGGLIKADLDIISALPPLLQTLTLNATTATIKGTIPALPPFLTRLAFIGARIPVDEYRHLPPTLTALYVPILNLRSITHIARLVNLLEFGAFEGQISAAVIRKLPRGILNMQLHGVALDTYTQRRWKKMNLSPESALQVFNGTLPPNLEQLIIFHHYEHYHYWNHAHELYRHLPTSLRELHLVFWRNRHWFLPRPLPSYIPLYDTSPGSEGQESDIFSRLVNLKALTFDYPATAGPEHHIPPLPCGLKDLYFECFAPMKPKDKQALPKGLVTFNSNQEGDFYYHNNLRYYFSNKGVIKEWGIPRGNWRDVSI